MKHKSRNYEYIKVLIIVKTNFLKSLPTSLCQREEKGSALIVTLLLIAILTGLVVDFVYEVYIDSATLSNWTNAQRASLIARSGQNLSAGFIEDSKKFPYTSEKDVELPIDRDFGPGIHLTVRIEDENSRFNVNSIIEPNGLTNDNALASLKKLLEYLNINPNLSLLIADWMDPDSEPRLPDSENVAKNAPLWSVDELKLIGGMNKDIFEKISPYVTVYGNNQVNINTADLPVLVSLGKDMTEELAKRIIDYRKTTPFERADQIMKVSGLNEAVGIKLQHRITVRAGNFRVVSKATVNEITRIIESVMDTSMNIHFWREG